MRYLLIRLLITSILLPIPAVFADDKPYALSTTAMIGDIVKQLVPSTINAKTMMGSGTDPHLYKPSRSDIINLLSAEIVFYNGNYLEGRMIEAIKKLEHQGKIVIPVTEVISKDKLIESSNFLGNFDPHVWMSPMAWIEVSKVIFDKLIIKYPAESEEISSKYQRLLAELNKLDQYIKSIVQTIPEKQKVLVTAHDAFSYFGRSYDLEVMGIQGISTDSEASVRDIEKLVNVLVDRQIRAVFIESTVSEKNISALLEGANARGHKVVIGGELFSDAMGKEGTYEGTYVGMLDHNATIIVRALGGVAPEHGMQGKLK